MKGRIIGVQAQMLRYNTLFGLQLCKRILKITDNLSRTLQRQSMSAAEGQALAEMTSRTLQGMRTNESFSLFFSLVNRLSERTGTEPPVLPRKRKAPQRYEIGLGEGFHSKTAEEHYRLQYYEVLDVVITSIKTRFEQPGYLMYKNLEDLLVRAANNQSFDESLGCVTALYKNDFDRSLLSAQLQNLGPAFTQFSRAEPASLRDCFKFLRDLSPAQRSFFSEVCRLAQLILVMPSTNAVSERTFSAMRRLKTYLRSTMAQSRLNHLMILNIYQEDVDSLDIDTIANEFIRGSEHRLRQFGKFTETT